MGLQGDDRRAAAYDRVDDGEAVAAMQKAGDGYRPAADRHQLARAHGDDEAAAAGEDDPLLARPADQPAQRRVDRDAMEAQIDLYRQHALDTFPAILKARLARPGDDDLPQHRRQRAQRAERELRA